jgi:hypothetical protein
MTLDTPAQAKLHTWKVNTDIGSPDTSLVEETLGSPLKLKSRLSDKTVCGIALDMEILKCYQYELKSDLSSCQRTPNCLKDNYREPHAGVEPATLRFRLRVSRSTD